MNYPECLTYLNRLGNEVLTMKFGLDTVRTLLDRLGNPHHQFPSILIAGTNGKGSTARFIDSICREAGLKTGLFTSPHLIKIEERIRISGIKISESDFAESFSKVVNTINTCQLPAHPTFFEIITATAFSYFAERAIQLGILEVGMGGRLDSTNAVNPIFSIITPISLDHQQYLGDTLPLIASEKAGVMRKGGTVVSAPQFPEVEKTLKDSARYLGASLRYLELDSFAVNIKDSGYSQLTLGGITYNLGVPGKFQATNALVAIEAIDELVKRGFAIDSVHRQRGIEKSRFSAVVQILKKDPLVLLDGGHNLAAIESLCQFIRDYTPEPRILVFGMMKDKAIAPALDKLKPFFSIIYLTQADRVRAASVERLAQFCPQGIPEEDPGSAYLRALGHNSTVVVTGSLHLVGAILKSQNVEV